MGNIFFFCIPLQKVSNESVISFLLIARHLKEEKLLS
jgi:hypothetical protein